jgi:FOG: Ankyrin repeat
MEFRVVIMIFQRGHTPLHKAAYAGSRECLTMLLKHGGDLSVMSAEGVSVMDTIYSHIPRPVNFITDTLDRHVIPNNADINTREFKVSLNIFLENSFFYPRN